MRLEGNDTYHNCYGLLIHGQYFDWDRDLQLFHDSCLLPRLVSFGLLTLKRWLELDFPENAIVLIVKDLTRRSWFLAGMESILKNLVSPSLS
jgi:hypothetical protein